MSCAFWLSLNSSRVWLSALGNRVARVLSTAARVWAEFAPSAYFLNERVRQQIGYAGQTALQLDERPDYLDDGLLDSVIRRGPIYRPTPSD